MGVLQGEELVDGALFRPEDQPFGSAAIKCGMGNRINIFVDNSIDYIDSDPPQYGLIFEWFFNSRQRLVTKEVGEDFWATFVGGVKTSRRFTGCLLELGDASPANPLVKAGIACYNFTALPNKIWDGSEGYFSSNDGRSNMILPITALGDYLNIRFYSFTGVDPYEYKESDLVRVWASFGNDAVGSSFLVKS